LALPIRFDGDTAEQLLFPSVVAGASQHDLKRSHLITAYRFHVAAVERHCDRLNSDIDSVASQCAEQPIMSAVDHMDIDIRKPMMILHEGRVHVTGGRRGIDTDRQPAILAAAPGPQSLEGGICFLDDASRCFKELLSSDSRSSTAIGSLEQICSKAILQITQSATEDGLTDVQYRRRLPKASMLGHDERPPQISKFDRQLLSSASRFFQQ
jgi:hypothetical protein